MIVTALRLIGEVLEIPPARQQLAEIPVGCHGRHGAVDSRDGAEGSCQSLAEPRCPTTDVDNRTATKEIPHGSSLQVHTVKAVRMPAGPLRHFPGGTLTSSMSVSEINLPPAEASLYATCTADKAPLSTDSCIRSS